MSKISNYVKKHKIFTAFLCLVLLLVLVWSGGRIYKIYHPNQAYYGTDFMYNSVAYDGMDNNWELLQNPTKKLCKVYETPHSLIPVGTLYGFENDKDHIIIQDNSIIFSPSTFMKIQDYSIFDVNCIDQVVVERRKRSPGEVDLVGRIEFTNAKEISSWISLIQDLREGKQKQTEAYPSHSEDLYSVSFYLKEMPHARYQVASIYLNEKIIEPDQTGSQPQYILPEEFINMISNAKEIPVTEVY